MLPVYNLNQEISVWHFILELFFNYRICFQIYRHIFLIYRPTFQIYRKHTRIYRHPLLFSLDSSFLESTTLLTIYIVVVQLMLWITIKKREIGN